MMERRAWSRMPGLPRQPPLVLALLLASALTLALALAGCATDTAPAGVQVPEQRLREAAVPGQTTKAQLLAAFGPTTHVRFDSGFESWLYQVAAPGGQFTEMVILIDPQGVVSKVRRGPTLAPKGR